MKFTLKQFQEWGAVGGRMRWQRLSDARRKQLLEKKVKKSKSPRSRGRPKGSSNGTSKVDVAVAIEMYKAGSTLADVGSRFGVTREYIRQILRKNGVPSDVGGQAIKLFLNTEDKVKKKAKAQTKRELRARRIWDLSLDEFEQIRKEFGPRTKSGSPFARFVSQRKNAKQRKIEWNLTFSQWWKIWKESGKFHLCGVGHGSYCMARWGDTDGYTVGNVKIIPSIENNSDRPQKKSGLPIGVTKTRNAFHPFEANIMINGISKRIGSFKTVKEASEAYQNALRIAVSKKKAKRK